jgi:hypothetical protein
MLTLLTALKDRMTIEGDDTGTYADGAIPMPMAELRGERGSENGYRQQFLRDYGKQRPLPTAALGYV